MRIRKANSEDIDWLLSELKIFSKVYTTKLSPFGDEAYVRPGILHLIENHLFLIAELASQPVGLIAGYVSPHFFNPKIRTLSEIFWWVSVEHRNSRAGFMLLREFMEWGKKNVDWITVALEKKSPVSADALLKRGFELQEHSFLMEVGESSCQ